MENLYKKAQKDLEKCEKSARKNYFKMSQTLFPNQVPAVRPSTKEMARTIAGIHISQLNLSKARQNLNS